MIPTVLAIMVVNFFIVQAAPGGPIEQMLSRLKGTDVAATERITGGGGELKQTSTRPAARAAIAAPAGSTRPSSRSWKSSTASTSRRSSASS